MMKSSVMKWSAKRLYSRHQARINTSQDQVRFSANLGTSPQSFVEGDAGLKLTFFHIQEAEPGIQGCLLSGQGFEIGGPPVFEEITGGADAGGEEFDLLLF